MPVADGDALPAVLLSTRGFGAAREVWIEAFEGFEFADLSDVPVPFPLEAIRVGEEVDPKQDCKSD